MFFDASLIVQFMNTLVVHIVHFFFLYFSFCLIISLLQEISFILNFSYALTHFLNFREEAFANSWHLVL